MGTINSRKTGGCGKNENKNYLLWSIFRGIFGNIFIKSEELLWRSEIRNIEKAIDFVTVVETENNFERRELLNRMLVLRLDCPFNVVH
ncbi:hypothetical protein T4D_15886 [Trichinella pseudospiralis]|uniref:Uncharacterized protein n=1 Tax=Trichinella pseudospiralis TaxID=6337 RepID=A0A0V1FNB9_TRIPS|nr:hypothetical protein T4D_15886 [Trichinella pseudospiralis]